MTVLCKILDALINPAIYILAIIEFVLLCVSVWTLRGFKKRISDLNKDNVKKVRLSKTKGKREVRKTVETTEARSWDDFEKFQRDYQKDSVYYSVFSLIIQLFTLLGILGTVVGLYIAMNNGEDLYKGVGLALSTTINGILFAVIYKLADIGITATLLNFIDDGMDIFVDSYKADSDDATRSAMIEQGSSKPNDAKTGDAKTGDAKTGNIKTGDAKTGDTKTGIAAKAVSGSVNDETADTRSSGSAQTEGIKKETADHETATPSGAEAESGAEGDIGLLLPKQDDDYDPFA